MHASEPRPTSRSELYSLPASPLQRTPSRRRRGRPRGGGEDALAAEERRPSLIVRDAAKQMTWCALRAADRSNDNNLILTCFSPDSHLILSHIHMYIHTQLFVIHIHTYCGRRCSTTRGCWPTRASGTSLSARTTTRA